MSGLPQVGEALAPPVSPEGAGGEQALVGGPGFAAALAEVVAPDAAPKLVSSDVMPVLGEGAPSEDEVALERLDVPVLTVPTVPTVPTDTSDRTLGTDLSLRVGGSERGEGLAHASHSPVEAAPPPPPTSGPTSADAAPPRDVSPTPQVITIEAQGDVQATAQVVGRGVRNARIVVPTAGQMLQAEVTVDAAGERVEVALHGSEELGLPARQRVGELRRGLASRGLTLETFSTEARSSHAESAELGFGELIDVGSEQRMGARLSSEESFRAALAGEDRSGESEVRTMGSQDRGAHDDSPSEPWGRGGDADSHDGSGQPETAADSRTPSSDVSPAPEADSASSAPASEDPVRTPYATDVPVGRILHTRL